jgi:phenol 2-monooxygenase
MVIPRENGLVRLYIQLSEIKPDASGRADRSKITPEVIIAAAQKTLAPYKITYKYCDWWTAYQIGQRVGNTFHKHNRVFLAGDAVHTHSPKAGQGMNVSMQDTYNLGWKIGLCVRKVTPRSILATYETERKKIANDLIDFDHRFSRLFSGRPAKDAADEAGISMAEFKNVFEKGNEFASGLSVNYEKSLLVAKPEKTAGTEQNGTAESTQKSDITEINKIKLGMRFPNFQVLNQSDARPWPLQQWLKSDGRFRIMLFAGNFKSETQRKRVETFCAALTEKSSFLQRVTPAGAPIDSVIEILTVHSAPRREVELLDFPDLLHPFDEAKGWDYNKVFVDDASFHEGDGKAYEGYGVDKEMGCVVAVRPDGYVGFMGELEDTAGLEGYFSVLQDGAGHNKKLEKRRD